MKVLKLRIQGHVQGVGYRRWFAQQAIALGLNGYVKNLDSGEVEALIMGHETELHQMLERSLAGPLRAHVTQIDQIELECPAVDVKDFKILRE